MLPTVDVVLPCLDEAEGLAWLLPRLPDRMRARFQALRLHCEFEPLFNKSAPNLMEYHDAAGIQYTWTYVVTVRRAPAFGQGQNPEHQEFLALSQGEDIARPDRLSRLFHPRPVQPHFACPVGGLGNREQGDNERRFHTHRCSSTATCAESSIAASLRYAHSPGEVIDIRDLDALSRIITVIVRGW